jgi:hypothetical protein
MGRNVKPIFAKIQNVMGIKNGKYCSSDVSVVSLNNNGGNPQSHTLGNKPEAPTNTIGLPSVTYTNCPNGERKTINFNEIQMNDNIIPDCVLGGSVTLTNLNGYVVNYGQTICTVTVKEIQSCNLGARNITVDFGDNVVTDGKVYSLSFNGISQPGCYIINGDSLSPSEDSVSSVQEVPNCLSCTPTPTLTPTPPQTYTEIQSCNDGSIYSVNGGFGSGNISYLTFKGGTVPNGCYTCIGETTNIPVDGISTVSPKYVDCITCISSQ